MPGQNNDKPHRNPVPTVDVIVELHREDLPKGTIVLIQRKNPPLGWALPGGFVDYGEPLEAAALRELKEETGLDAELFHQLHTYSDPQRDARLHTISTVYAARSSGRPVAGDDAAQIGLFTEKNLPEVLAFDHARILADYFEWRRKQ